MQKSGILPSCFKDMGYSEGDTVTSHHPPLQAVVDEDSDIIKQARAELKEKYGTKPHTNGIRAMTGSPRSSAKRLTTAPSVN